MTEPLSTLEFSKLVGQVKWTKVMFTMEADLSPADFTRAYEEAIFFCTFNIDQRWFKILREFYFENPAEAMVFKLRYN